MPAVEKITIAGFKSIAKAEVELRPVNVLIGANGSGKSNFMEAFSLLRAIGAGQLPDYVARARRRRQTAYCTTAPRLRIH